LRKLRLEKKLTQEQVAEKLGVSAQSVSRWETGATFPDVMMLPEISSLYGVLVDDLFKESPQGYSNLADRLLAVYEDTYKHEDFMTAYLEYQRMEKESTMTAEDYRGYGWLHNVMRGVCKNKTLEYYGKSMELSKENDTEFYYLMKCCMISVRIDLGEGQKCIEEQLQAVKAEPENAGELVCLVCAYCGMKQYEECYRVVKDAIAKYPEEPRLYGYAGEACEGLEKYDEAFTYWERHLELQSRWLESLVSIAFCREKLGEYDKAYEAWMRLVDILLEKGSDVSANWPREQAKRCKEKMGKQE
ncbi:MAG: helix-turn-helix domain-containing protein, partial [Lachnospiraceae bacterium]|nr:helix-turn-helix domain-containing protein [Lachnospiraceae bacterium]